MIRLGMHFEEKSVPRALGDGAGLVRYVRLSERDRGAPGSFDIEQIAAGASWVGEYGSVANPDEAAFLAKISPYNNLKPDVTYPEPLIWTTTKDDRVGPQHARKFAAKLAAMGKPYLFYEVTEGGHGSGANQEESARTTALEMVYFIRKLMD